MILISVLIIVICYYFRKRLVHEKLCNNNLHIYIMILLELNSYSLDMQPKCCYNSITLSLSHGSVFFFVMLIFLSRQNWKNIVPHWDAKFHSSDLQSATLVTKPSHYQTLICKNICYLLYIYILVLLLSLFKIPQS